MDSYTRRCQTNYTFLSPNHSKLGRRGTRFVLVPSLLGAAVDLGPQARLVQAKEQVLQGWIGDFEENRIQVHGARRTHSRFG